MMNRFSSWAHRNMPTREQMEGNRFIRPFAGRVLRSELWRFTRRSVPRGVALRCGPTCRWRRWRLS
jgi:hypothetical protein